MVLFDFRLPTRIIFGSGAISELGIAAQQLSGKRVLVVSDAGIVAAGHAPHGIELLRNAGLIVELFDGVAENPTTDHVDAGLAVAKAFQPDLIVGIGGGSSMDCAKGINFLYSCGGRMQDYWGQGKATGPLLPMIAMPTTAGTGSETQSYALIADAKSHVKMACGDKRAAFRIAILDPDLTLTQPPRVTALTGIDAISHAIETYVCKAANPISRMFSQQAWSYLFRGFADVLESPRERPPRESMQLGACFAGLAIENSMLGAAHALANPLTAMYGIAHGEAIGIVLPHVILRNGESDAAARFEELCRDVDPEESSFGGDAAQGLAAYIGDMVDRGGLACCLSDCGVDRERLPALAADANKQWTGKFNPVELTETDFLKLYEAAF